MRTCFLILTIALAVPAAVAQNTSAPPQNQPNAHVTNLPPYYAEFKSTVLQPYVNGLTVRGESMNGSARDGQGRSSSFNPLPPNGKPGLANFRIDDPVAGTEKTWNSREKVVLFDQLPPKDQRLGCYRNQSGYMMWRSALTPEQQAEQKARLSSQPRVRPVPRHSKAKDLGTDTILGLQVRHWLTKWTFPTDSIGNDRPLVATKEVWHSDAYDLDVKSIDHTQQGWEFTTEMTKFVPGEPDPSIFQLPQDYTVFIRPVYRVPCN